VGSKNMVKDYQSTTEPVVVRAGYADFFASAALVLLRFQQNPKVQSSVRWQCHCAQDVLAQWLRPVQRRLPLIRSRDVQNLAHRLRQTHLAAAPEPIAAKLAGVSR